MCKPGQPPCGSHEAYEEIGKFAAAVRSDLRGTAILGVETWKIPAVGGDPITRSFTVPFAALSVNVVSAGGTAVSTSVTQAGGAATSAVLPAGSSVTGFDVDFQGPAAAVSGVVTLTGLNGASGTTLSYDVTVPTSGLLLPVRFPNPLAPLSAAATPQVNVPVLAAGPAYSATIYGITAPSTPLTVTNAPPGASAPSQGPGMAVLPAGKGGTINMSGHSYTIYGGTPGDLVTVQLYTRPQPAAWG